MRNFIIKWTWMVDLGVKFFLCLFIFLGLLPLQSSSFYGSRTAAKDYSPGSTNLDRYHISCQLPSCLLYKMPQTHYICTPQEEQNPMCCLCYSHGQKQSLIHAAFCVIFAIIFSTWNHFLLCVINEKSSPHSQFALKFHLWPHSESSEKLVIGKAGERIPEQRLPLQDDGKIWWGRPT